MNAYQNGYEDGYNLGNSNEGDYEDPLLVLDYISGYLTGRSVREREDEDWLDYFGDEHCFHEDY